MALSVYKRGGSLSIQYLVLKMMKINEAIGNISEWTNYYASKQSNLID